MGRKAAKCSKDGFNRGAWRPVEDEMLMEYVKIHGEGKWSNISKETGLKRCGKSCRLRWMNYLRPNIKRGNISDDEVDLIIRLHKLLGNRWSLIAGRLPGRTDNEVKNYWHTHIAKKAQLQDSKLHKKSTRVAKKQLKSVASQNQSTAPSNSNNLLSTIESHCTVKDAAGPAAGTLIADHQVTASQTVEETDDHQVRLTMATMAAPPSYENEVPSGKGLESAGGGGDDNSSNIIMDFTAYIEDIWKILDSPDVSPGNCSIHDIVNDHQYQQVDADNGLTINGFPEKLLETDWCGAGSNNECVQITESGAATAGFDFMPLVSFLDSTDDWSEDALRTIMH